MRKDFVGLFEDIVGRDGCFTDEPMSRHTSFRVGGPADILLAPRSTEELSGILKVCREHELPILVMGNGTNLIVRDKGIRGVVVKLFNGFNHISADGNEIVAEAGCLLSRIARTALENELAGLEFAEGIPGTLGGAVTMNAGAYDGEMKDVVAETECMDTDGNLRTLRGAEHGFSYRTSIIQKEGIVVLRTRMLLKKGIHEDIRQKMEGFARARKEKQPLELPSAGSIFRRPQGYYTGKLVEDCGLKGCRIGGAEVSAKHCGFIVNAGGATASDIIRLIGHVQDTVRDRFGVSLQTEVKIVGEE